MDGSSKYGKIIFVDNCGDIKLNNIFFVISSFYNDPFFEFAGSSGFTDIGPRTGRA